MSAERTVFGRLQNTFDPPDLIEIQTQSFRDCLQLDVPPAQREEKGLQATFCSPSLFLEQTFPGRSRSYSDVCSGCWLRAAKT